MFRMGKEEVEAVARVIETKELFRVNNGLHESEKFEEEYAKVIAVESGRVCQLVCTKLD